MRAILSTRLTPAVSPCSFTTALTRVFHKPYLRPTSRVARDRHTPNPASRRASTMPRICIQHSTRSVSRRVYKVKALIRLRPLQNPPGHPVGSRNTRDGRSIERSRSPSLPPIQRPLPSRSYDRTCRCSADFGGLGRHSTIQARGCPHRQRPTASRSTPDCPRHPTITTIWPRHTHCVRFSADPLERDDHQTV